MRHKQSGFTVLEIILALFTLGIIVSFAVGSLRGVKEAGELRALSEQALDLVNYVEKVRRTPSSTTVGAPTYPGGSPNTHTYMSLAAGSTVTQFRAEYLNEFGESAPILPQSSPFETPYLITLTNDTAFLEVSVPFNDVNIQRAEATVIGSNTVFRFYPSVEAESAGTDRTAGSNFTKSFVGETVR